MTIRTAIIGYGRTGSTLHADPIEKNHAFRMTAVCDIDPDKRRQAAERFKCPVYEDYREMLKQEKLDLAAVLTRTDQHAAMACDCLRAGVNTLVTKPWAVNADEARRMIATAQSSGKLLLPWLPTRWSCELRRLREVVSSGAIGKVFFIRRAVSSFGTRNDWQTLKKYGGGYVLNWGPHIVDPPVLLAGSKVKSVFAKLKQVMNPGDVEDLFYALLTLEDGTLVQAEYTIAVESFPSWVVQGDRGTITIAGNKLRLMKQTPPCPTDPTAYAAMQAHAPEVTEETVTGAVYGDEHEIYREIADALTGGKPYPATTAAALEVSRVLDAMKTSSAENRVVVL